MAHDPLTALLDVGSKLIDKFLPDAGAKDAAKLELLKMHQSGELAILAAETQLATAQIATNTAEANNSNLFVSGWRPGVGWVCVAGLAFNFIVQPMLVWLSSINTWPVPPQLDIGDLLTLLLGMLGLGGLRTAEKIKGVAAK